MANSFMVAESTNLTGARIFSLQATKDIQNGAIVAKGDLVTGEKSVYKADDYTTGDKYLVLNPAWSYDNNRMTDQNEENYVNKAGVAFRAYKLEKDMKFKISNIAETFNIGDEIDFIGIDKAGNVKYSEHLINKDGIISSLMLRTQSPIVAPIYFKDDTGEMKAEVAFTYDASDLTSPEDIVSYANFTPTDGGTHVNGVMDGICNYFRNYMNKIYLGEKSKISVINNDIKTGMKIIIAAAHLNPVFAGQFKGILSNEDMLKYTKDLTMRSLEAWAKTNPGDLQKICKYIKDIAEIRSKSDDSKVKLSSNYEASAITGKPKKYVPPSGNKNLELIIVEGDSALGSAKNSRDYKCQGLYPERTGL